MIRGVLILFFLLKFLFYAGSANGASCAIGTNAINSIKQNNSKLDKIYNYLDEHYADIDANLGVGRLESELADAQMINNIEELLNSAKEHYATLLSSPLNINSATASDLEQLVILSTFEIEALLIYRNEHGAILSASELALVVGFNNQKVNLLDGFITFSKNGYIPYGSNLFRGDLLYKSSIDLERGEYIGTPFYSHLKYKSSWNNKYSVDFIAQNDVGELFLSPLYLPMADFLSFNFTANNLNVSKEWGAKVIVGDYTAKLAQGLTIYKGFAMSGSSAVSSLYKRGDVLRGYSSGSEYNYLRGVGVTLKRENLFEYRCNWEFNVFGSNKGVDANVVDGKYTSIATDGLHNSFASYTKRHSMRQLLLGARAECEGATFKIGVNGVTYCYSLENGRRISNYNMYQQFNGWWGNFSLDYYLLLAGGRFFGEVAVDYGGAAALLSGYIYSSGAVEVGALIRNYGIRYIAPEASCYGSTSGCNNQRGATLFISHNNWGSKYEAGVDFVYYPWERYNIPYSSLTSKLFLKWSGMVEHWSGYLKGSYSYASYKNVNKFGVKCNSAYQISKRVTAKFRGEIAKVIDITAWSVNGCSELVYSSLSRKLKINCSVGGFFAPEWSNRLYVYEGDLPLSFNSLLLYGRGIYGYIMAKWELFRDCDIYLKQNFMFKQRLVDVKDMIMNETEEEESLLFGESSSNSKLKFGLQIKF